MRKKARSHNREPARVPVPFGELGYQVRSNLPEKHKPTYDAYLNLLFRGDFVAADALAESYCRPEFWGDNPEEFKVLSQAFLMFSKVSRKGDQEAEKKAWKKFLKYEQKCRRTNRRLRWLQQHPDRIRGKFCSTLGYYQVQRIKSVITDILGPLTPGVYRKIISGGYFGPGATLSSSDSTRVTVPYKLTDTPSVTRDCLPVWRDALNQFVPGMLHWRDLVWDYETNAWRGPEWVEVAQGCRITFVDKTSVIKRTIAIEPSANGFLQLGVHSYLKGRLSRVGIDITDQTRNRSLAWEGSLSGTLATIDLSSASDCVAYELVKWFLPPDWFSFLSALRSSQGTYKSETVVFEKFSSMGNGFTFALETLLFFAIAKVAGEVAGLSDSHPAVYGDDIIIESHTALLLVEWLRLFGFQVNPGKSFILGPFKESCGMDALRGNDVRPVFVRGETLTITEIVALHNLLWDKGFRDLARVVEHSIPLKYRLYGPPGPSSGYLFTDSHEKLASMRTWSDDWQTWVYRAWHEKPVLARHSNHALLFASLFSGGAFSTGAPQRFRTKLVRLKASRDH